MDIEDLTLQLRRAYRLVHGYQRATIDLAREIATRLGLEFFSWSPVFNDPPGQRRTDITRNWAWDLLPVYSIYIAFTTPGPIRKGSYMLIVWAEADSGFSDLCNKTTRGEPDVMKLAPPESCETRIHFLHAVVEDSPKVKDSQAFWKNLWEEDWQETENFVLEIEGSKLQGGMATHPLSDFRNVEELNARLAEFKACIAKTVIT